MKISADKVKLCYTLYEDSPLYQLMETPLEIYELPHWDFRLERTEGKYYNYIYKIIYLERTSNTPNGEYDMQCFGTLRWGLKADKEGEMSGFVWIEIDNKQLYLTYHLSTLIRKGTSYASSKAATAKSSARQSNIAKPPDLPKHTLIHPVIH